MYEVNEDKGIHPERNQSSYERSIVRSGEQRGSIRSGMRTRGNGNEGETYWVRTRLELAGVVSEQVLTASVCACALVLGLQK